MTNHHALSRRSFLALMASVPAAARAAFPTGSPAAAGEPIPVGLELYSVRNDLAKDLTGTVQAVAKMGYQCVEFFSPYYEWTSDYAKPSS